MQVEVVDGINVRQDTQATSLPGGKRRECQFSSSFIPEKTEVCAIAEVQRDATKCVECVGGQMWDRSGQSCYVVESLDCTFPDRLLGFGTECFADE